jgi:glucose-6-phosphate-specific signal transduction histidine kinase
MRVHDEMGKCLLATQRYLKDDTAKPLPGTIVSSWKKAVSMLKYSNETKDDDMMLEIRKTCAFVKMDFIQTGQLPGNEKTAYLLTCAVRECVTNAVRYADAAALYVDFSETLDAASVVITNNGKLPEGEIKEGGGLSTLRRRIEREGGSMVVQAQPTFGLTVTIPKNKEGVL